MDDKAKQELKAKMQKEMTEQEMTEIISQYMQDNFDFASVNHTWVPPLVNLISKMTARDLMSK